MSKKEIFTRRLPMFLEQLSDEAIEVFDTTSPSITDNGTLMFEFSQGANWISIDMGKNGFNAIQLKDGQVGTLIADGSWPPSHYDVELLEVGIKNLG